jgi:hypothetical protein
MLVYYIFMIMLLLYSVIVAYHEDRSRPCVRAIFIQIKTGLSSCLRNLFGYVTFLHFKAPNGISLLADSSL